MNLQDLKPVNLRLLLKQSILPAAVLLLSTTAGVYWLVRNGFLGDLLVYGLFLGWPLVFVPWAFALEFRGLWLGMMPHPAERHRIRLDEGRLEIERGTEELSIPLEQVRKIRWVNAGPDYDAASNLDDAMVVFLQDGTIIQVSLWKVRAWELWKSLSAEGLWLEDIEVRLPSWI